MVLESLQALNSKDTLHSPWKDFFLLHRIQDVTQCIPLFYVSSIHTLNEWLCYKIVPNTIIFRYGAIVRRKMFDIMRTCPRTGRLVYRKQKLFLYIALTACAMYGVVLFTYPSEIFAPLRPLANAESEARRLIKFITHYHLHCNVTSHVGNLSYWPICNEKEFGIDIDNKDDKLAYFVGWVLLTKSREVVLDMCMLYNNVANKGISMLL